MSGEDRLDDDEAAAQNARLHGMALAIMGYARQPHDPSATDALQTRATSAIIHPTTIHELAQFANTEPFAKGKLFGAIFTILTQHLQYVGSAGEPGAVPVLAGQVLPSLLALHDALTQGRNTFHAMGLDDHPDDAGYSGQGLPASALTRNEADLRHQLDTMILNLAFYLEDNAKQRGRAPQAFSDAVFADPEEPATLRLADHPFHDPRVAWILRQHAHDPQVKSMWAASTSQDQMKNRQQYFEDAAAKNDRLGMLAAANFYFMQAASSDEKQHQAYEKACRYLESALQDIKVRYVDVAVADIGKNNTVSQHIFQGVDAIQERQNLERHASHLGAPDFYWHQLVAADLGEAIASLRHVIFANFLKNYIAILQKSQGTRSFVGLADAYDDNLTQRFKPEIDNISQQPAHLQQLWAEFTQLRDAALAAASGPGQRFDPRMQYRTKGMKPHL